MKKIRQIINNYNCETTVLGLGLGVDFTFAWDNNNNNNKYPHIDFLGLRDNGKE